MDRGIIIKNLESAGFEVFLSVIIFFEKELLLLTERRFQFHFGNTAGNAKGYTNAEREKEKPYCGGGHGDLDIIFVEGFPNLLCFFLECGTIDFGGLLAFVCHE
jgi:hypothetical protein